MTNQQRLPKYPRKVSGQGDRALVLKDPPEEEGMIWACNGTNGLLEWRQQDHNRQDTLSLFILWALVYL